MNDDLTDMHCHLGFASNGEELVSGLSSTGIKLLTNTVDPREWAANKQAFGEYPFITIGYGWHPWWITKESSPKLLLDFLEEFQPRALGEIGLDFGEQNAQTKDEQVAIFKTFAEWATCKGDCLLSIHAVQAAVLTLDILEEAHVFDACSCIYHWFSGTSDDLTRALDFGCFFSINPRMVSSKKGREYVKQIPLERLLLESDLPREEHANLAAGDLVNALSETTNEISRIKGPYCEDADCAKLINETAQRLLSSVRD